MKKPAFLQFDNLFSSFWKVQFLGFAFYTVVDFLQHLIFSGYSTHLLIELGKHLFHLFCLTALLRLIYRRIDIQKISIARLIPRVVLSSLFFSTVLLYINLITTAVIFYSKEGGYFYLLNHLKYYSVFWTLFLYTMLLGSWSALYFIIKIWRSWENQKKATETAQALIQQAQLQMLRYRLNPHFLFNTLNAIRVLIQEDKYTAKHVITELSEFLRYSLISRKQQTVTLAEEIQAVQYYLNIAKQRYEEKINIRFNIDEKTREASVISFMLPPLVENALKYGLRTSSLPLEIELTSRKTDDTILIEIKNSGYWIPPVTAALQFAQGINNVEQRLNNTFGPNASLNIFEQQNCVVARIQIKTEECLPS